MSHRLWNVEGRRWKGTGTPRHVFSSPAFHVPRATFHSLCSLLIASYTGIAFGAEEPPRMPVVPPPVMPWQANDPLLTLPECYALALTRSETIAIQQELIRETEGRFLQAFSGG